MRPAVEGRSYDLRLLWEAFSRSRTGTETREPSGYRAGESVPWSTVGKEREYVCRPYETHGVSNEYHQGEKLGIWSPTIE